MRGFGIVRGAVVCAGLVLASPAGAGTEEEQRRFVIEEIVVYGRADDLIGIAPAASAGTIGQAELERIPLLRAGEILETIPGLIATQHSGTGKANQFFLRGFNLDHGTDFSTFLEGVPLNLPTHGHGQGYLDVNSVIPEIIEVLEYRKGPYYADTGDFSSAGTSRIRYVRRLERPFLEVGFGEDAWYRVVGGLSRTSGGGDLLLAGELQLYDGPWEQEEDLEKRNGVAKWTWGDEERELTLFASAYAAEWRATDQVPRRAVRSGRIGRLGNLDDDLGGKTSRYTGSIAFRRGLVDATRVQAYAVRYDLDLWSNFTYFLDDPVNGDELRQLDERTFVGVDLSQELDHSLGASLLGHTFGLDVRHDFVRDVGLFRTAERERIATVRRDRVDVTRLGAYWSAEASLLAWLRASAGLRGDVHWFDVDARSLPLNSGRDRDGIVSPKAGLVLGPWASTESYLSYGRGFHSNDARGTTIRVDPQSGEPVGRVDPLVASQGAEIGARTAWIPGLRSTLALWWLDLDSELLFVGDAGTTEASRPSRRYGLEAASFWSPLEWLTLDADVTLTRSRFRDEEPEGDEIPGAVRTTVAAGGAVSLPNGFFASLRVRHFGARPLVEDGSVESGSTTLFNARSGWTWRDFPWGELELRLDVLNLAGSRDDDITYFYASRLPDEPAEGVEDVHFHPVEPRSLRGYVRWRF